MHARNLMNRPDRKAPFDLALIPTPEEVKDFDPKNGPCCDPDRFRPDLNSSPGTPWNVSAIRVFAQSFVDSDEYDCDDVTLVAKMFRTHLRYLGERYKLRMAEQADQEKAQKAANRYERKRGVSTPTSLHGFDSCDSSHSSSIDACMQASPTPNSVLTSRCCGSSELTG